MDCFRDELIPSETDVRFEVLKPWPGIRRFREECES